MKLFTRATPAPTRTDIPTSISDVLANPTPRAYTVWFMRTNRTDLNDQISTLKPKQALVLSDILTPHTGAELLEALEPLVAADFLVALPLPVAAGLLDALDEDDAAEIVRLCPQSFAATILKAMNVSHSARVRGLLSWPEDSVASRMRPSFLSVPSECTIGQAVDAVRPRGDAVIEGVYVTVHGKSGQRVLGWLSVTDLVLGESDVPVTALMEDVSTVRLRSLSPLADQDEIMRLFHAQRVDVIPVLDDDIILGVVTADMVDDVLREEMTEDAERQGGSSPLEVPYLHASPWMLWRKRVVWLIVLFVAEMYTGTVLRTFEDELSSVVALAFFIPLLIGTGGNTGTQITTTLIRAMSIEGVRMRDIGRVIWKELRTGVLLGITMAVLGFVRAWTLGVGMEVMLTVALSLVAIVVWSAFIASMLPLLLKKLRIDPAVVSSPLISTLVDGTGLVIYFMIARVLI